MHPCQQYFRQEGSTLSVTLGGHGGGPRQVVNWCAGPQDFLKHFTPQPLPALQTLGLWTLLFCIYVCTVCLLCGVSLDATLPVQPAVATNMPNLCFLVPSLHIHIY